MKRLASFALLATAMHAASSPRAAAQPMLVPQIGVAQPRLLVGLTLDPALTLSVQCLWPVNAGRQSGLFVGGGVKMPTTIVSHRAWRLELTTAAYQTHENGWGESGQATAYIAHNQNAAGSMQGVGAEVRGAAGRRGPNAFWGLELGWQNTFATFIAHAAPARAAFRDRYTMTGAADSLPDNGWYRSAAQRVRVGAVLERRTGWRGSAAQIALGGLFIRQKQQQRVAFDLAQIPLYLETSVRFPQ
jgi:hypothetical protein